MINPQSKSIEYYNVFIERIGNNGTISELEYKRALKSLSNDQSIEAICAIGLAHALVGREVDAINWFKTLTPFTNLFVLKSFGVVLRHFGRNKELINLSLGYADHFRDVWFSWMSMEYYYIIGDISNSARKAREFLNMLHNNDNKKHAEYSITQQLNSLSLVYSSGYCTPEQFKEISDLVMDILDNHGYAFRYIELFYYEGEGASYEVGIDLDKDDFNTLSVLNTEVVKRMIEIKDLDNCDLTPCFSCDGMSNWRYIHGTK
ncbi:hypothetical protein [Serratia proteamaculans]|uniref:hypothetical protein n=1 Tax=Serratia proteamaculans TaxID=28151 RepID=UPI003CFFB0A1